MTHVPVRIAASEPSQHTTETKKVELNKLYSNTFPADNFIKYKTKQTPKIIIL